MSEFSDRFPIRETIKQHDRYQFETRFDYFIETKKRAHFELRKKHVYYMDAYFFIPKLMGINAESYKKSHFYEDIRSLLRFKEPHFSYGDLQGSNPEKESPFGRIEYLIALLNDQNPENRIELKAELMDQIKYFSCSFVSNFRRKVRKRCRVIKEDYENKKQGKVANVPDPFEGLNSFLKKHFSLLRRFAELRNTVAASEEVQENLILEMMLAEEYCFYRFREGVALVVETVNLLPVTSDEKYLEAKRKLKAWSRFINWYERSYHFVSIGESTSTADREGFLSRLGNIKKYLSRVLYLEVKPNILFSVRIQAGYMLGAAVAALWYFLANLFIFSYLQFGGFNAGGGMQNFLGFSGTTIVLAFVFAYVLKDRIKELSRIRFQSGVFRKMPDYLYNIYYKSGMIGRTYIGKLSESVKFIRNKDVVPDDILRIREQTELWEEKHQYDILFYQKKVELDSLAIQKVEPKFFSVKHIIRFSIRRFLTRLDDPIQIYLGLDKKGLVQEIGMPKVYYVGVAIKYYSPNKKESSGFDYQVLVVNKNGLVRIDEVARSVRV